MAHLGAAGLVRSAELVQLAPALSIRVAPPGPWVVVAYYLAVVSACLTLRHPWQGRAFTTAAALAGVWIVAEPWAVVARRGDGRLHVTFLDVGQGDAALVRFPRGGTMLVDAGGLSQRSRFDIGDRVVAPVLRTHGVHRLDFLVVTHGDPDHIGGATSIVREFRPREIWEGIPVPPLSPCETFAPNRWQLAPGGRTSRRAIAVRWTTSTSPFFIRTRRIGSDSASATMIRSSSS